MSETAMSSDKDEAAAEQAEALAPPPSVAVIDAVADAQAQAATDAVAERVDAEIPAEEDSPVTGAEPAPANDLAGDVVDAHPDGEDDDDHHQGEPDIDGVDIHGHDVDGPEAEPQVVATIMELAEDEADQPEASAPQPAPEAAVQTLLPMSGWFSAEPDGIIRGWAMDRTHLDRRLTVAILIDDEPVGTVAADRPHARLIEQGEGDGHYAFAFAVPMAFRDGRKHVLAAEVLDPGYGNRRLKIKEPEFAISPDVPIPRFFLQSVSLDTIDGVMVNVRPNWDGEIDVWLDGKRLPADTVRVDNLGRDQARSNLRIRLTNHRPLELLSRSVVVVYPGIQEVLPEDSSIGSLLKADIRPAGESRFTLTLGAGLAIPDGHELLAVQTDEFGQKLAQTPVRFANNTMEFQVPEESDSELLHLSLTNYDGTVIAADLPFAVNSTRRLLTNGTFENWSATGPEDWNVGAGVNAERGFYAFPPAMKQQYGLSGKTALFHLAAGSDEQVVLRQPLRRTSRLGATPVELTVGFLGRASRQVELELRLVDAQANVISSLRFVTGSRWKLGVRALTLSRPDAAPSSLSFEVAVRALAGQEDAFIELAGLRCGDTSEKGFDTAPAKPRPAPMRQDINLLINPELQSWPNGLSMVDKRSRFEVAEGWFVFNRKSPAPVRASAIAVPDVAGGEPHYGVSLDVPQVPEYCRLEISLDVEELYGSARLDFVAACNDVAEDPASRFLFDKKWGQIDKIYLLKRETVTAGQKTAQVDTTVATIARRILLSRDWEQQSFSFSLDAAEQGGEFEPATVEEKLVEYFLMLEFRRPVQISLHSVNLRLVRSLETAPAFSPQQLEDANIRAQVASIKGLEHWISPKVARPAVMGSPLAGVAPEPQRWNRSHSALGSVDVGICVYNAADETLACLQSLVGSSTVPHMVRIINDGSGEDCRQRILQFIADKPWMQLIDNGENRGYTASANRAILESDADWVILLNSDTIVSPGWIEGLLEVAATDPTIAFVGPMSNAATFQSVPELYDGGGKWAINDLPEGWTPADLAAVVAQKSQRGFPQVALLNGFCTLIRRKVFEALGGLNEKAFPAGYGEENDLCVRAGKAGHKLCVADHVYVYHVKSASFGSARRLELAKAGDKMLKSIHSEVDFSSLTRRFMETPSLAHLRSAVRDAYKGQKP